MEKTPLGRPAKIKGKLVMVNLDALSHALAAQLGHGNVSAGVRFALQQAVSAPPPQPAAPAPRLCPEPPQAQSFPVPTPYPPGFGPK